MKKSSGYLMPGPSRRAYSSLGLLALLALLHPSQLPAVEIDDPARANEASGPQAETAWISGGVGDEALVEMRKVAANYNVQVMFSGRQGSYLAAVPFTVARSNGQPVLSGVTAGPLLYMKLAPGTYQLAAQIDGAWQSKRIRALASGPAAKASFVSKWD